MTPPPSSEIKIAVLEERIDVYERMMGKIDSAIEKISENSQNISQMLAIHNEKIDQCNKIDDVILKMVEEMKEDSKEQHEEIKKELNERIDMIEVKVDSLSQFRWRSLGALGLITFALSAFPFIKTVYGSLTVQPNTGNIERSK
jgi:DNA repair ATPase RecN